MPQVKRALPHRTVPPMLILLAATASPARPPTPAHDTPDAALPIGPEVPVVIFGSTVGAEHSPATAGSGPFDGSDGPDVFYRFSPPESRAYRIQLLPWQRAPLRSLDRRFVLFVHDEGGAVLSMARAADDARPVHLDALLEADHAYLIAVDHPAGAHDAFEFTLILDALPAVSPEGCGSGRTLTGALPVAALGQLLGAAADYTLISGEGRCAVPGNPPASARGPDHVYRFTPPEDGDYAIELATSGAAGFDAVLYVSDACPPNFENGCLGASDHTSSTGAGGRHELLAVTLQAGQDYWIYVDAAGPLPDEERGVYALIVDRASEYEITETEPNDGPQTSTRFGDASAGGQLVGPADVDWWSLSGSAGDRVYAWVNNGGTANGALDTDLSFIAPDGTTLIEFDAEDADGADAPTGDLRFVHSTTAGVIAGARMRGEGPHFLKVAQRSSSAARTVHRYRMHAGVQPATRAPTPECEPNNSTYGADYSAKHYYVGAIGVADDVDQFAFHAEAGDRVFIALDGDPERDGAGKRPAAHDPRALAARLAVSDPTGDLIISDISDPNTVQSPPDSPAQAGFFIARATGPHYVAIAAQQPHNQAGTEKTYALAIFLNNAAPSLFEDRDPVLTLAPDVVDDRITVIAADEGEGASGLCDVELIEAVNVATTGLDFKAGVATTGFMLELVDATSNGSGKLVVIDCAGNTAAHAFFIDAHDPTCDGYIFARRTLKSAHPPMHIPDGQPDGPGVEDVLIVHEPGTVWQVRVTVTLETTSVPDLGAALVGPDGTVVELFSDRGGPNAFSITDATFDDDVESVLPAEDAGEPYTGRWRPQDPSGLAAFIGRDARGTWRLRVRDDSSAENGGARLVRWSLDLTAEFPGPQSFAGEARDTGGPEAGIRSIELVGGRNLELRLPENFAAGMKKVEYRAALIDASTNGAGTLTVTDLSGNTCMNDIALLAAPDVTPPANRGILSRDVTLEQEAQIAVPTAEPGSVISTIIAPRVAAISAVEVGLTIDTRDVGRLVATLSRGGEPAVLLNRVGQEERGGGGLTKNSLELIFDDDAPATADAHLEPAAGAVAFRGVRQPDGRGQFLGDAISSDARDHQLFRLLPPNAPASELLPKAAGDSWDLFVGHSPAGYEGRTVLRRWSLTLKSPCGAERYSGTATDPAPGSGICSIALAGENVRLRFKSGFAPGDETVSYMVELDDPYSPGAGTLQIIDCSSNALAIPVRLLAAGRDNYPPLLEREELADSPFVAFRAGDQRPGDAGVAAVELAPYADNLAFLEGGPDLSRGRAPEVQFWVQTQNAGANGRGYVRVADGCGLRTHVLVELDVTPPGCSGAGGRAEDPGLYDAGMCGVALLEGSKNLTLTVQPFEPGDAVVKYALTQMDPDRIGHGTLRSTDCAGNVTDTPVAVGGPTGDCNSNGTPDNIDLALGTTADCNHNEVPDECDLLAGTSVDANTNGTPDDCEDRNAHKIPSAPFRIQTGRIRLPGQPPLNEGQAVRAAPGCGDKCQGHDILQLATGASYRFRSGLIPFLPAPRAAPRAERPPRSPAPAK